MERTSPSYRDILRGTSVAGAASAINVVMALIRAKALAVLVGPAGLGLVGLYTSFVSTAAGVATVGLGTAGVRQIAALHDDAAALAAARRALFLGTALLAGVAAPAVWLLRETLAELLFGSDAVSGAIGWLSLGVSLSVIATSQTALIQGARRIGDLAGASALGAILNTALGVAVLWLWREDGLVAYVVIGPLAGALVGWFYGARVPKPVASAPAAAVLSQWRALTRLGLAFAATGLAQALIYLWIRIAVNDELGTAALGYFQAAWSLSTQYIGFVLAAMAADYYPRLTGLIGDPQAAAKLVNQQTEVALLLCAPAFVAMIGLADWLVVLLYDASFAPAAGVLRWQVLADVLKVASWPLGFVILAYGDAKTGFATEVTTLLILAGLIIGLAPAFGLAITGAAFVAAYLYMTPLVYWLARRRLRFAWSGAVTRLLLLSLLACGVVAGIAWTTRWGAPAGVVAGALFGAYSLRRLSQLGALRAT